MQTKSLFLLLLVFSLMLTSFFTVKVDAPTPIEATKDYLILEVTGKNCVFQDENVTVKAASNLTPINITVYDSTETLAYTAILEANSTFTYTPLIYGCYTVKAQAQNKTAETWFHLANAENLTPFTLPYSWAWKGINYTLNQNYELEATRNGETFSVEWLSEIFTKLKPSITLYRNSELLYVGTYGKDISADSWIMNTYFGVKIRVNGSLAKTTMLKWNYKAVNTEILWNLNSIRAGHIVLDYSDFNRSTGLTYMLDKTGLKLDVTLETAFDVDPVIFSDGFEDGTLDAWTGTSGTPTIQSSVVYDGTYAMQVDPENDEYAYKTINAETNVYVRTYFRLSSNPTEYWFGLVDLRYDTGENDHAVLAYSNVYPNYLTSSLYIAVGESDYNAYNVVLTPDTWYCLEIEYDAEDDSHHVYLDGVERCSLSSSVSAGVYQVSVGCFSHYISGSNPDFYFDAVAISDSYVGTEVGEAQHLSFELTATAIATASLTSQKNLFRSGQATATATLSLYAQKSLHRSISATTAATTNLATQKALTKTSAATVTTTTDTANVKTLIRSSGASVTTTTSFESSKSITELLVETIETATASATLTTVKALIRLFSATASATSLLDAVKHLATTLIELAETATVTAVLTAVLPVAIEVLTAEEALAVGFVFALIALSIACAALIMKRK